MKSVLAKLALVGCSLLVTAVLLEIVVRVYLALHTVYDVEMTRYALLAKTASSNPRIGHVHKPNASATLMNVPVQINSDGLRDREHAFDHDNRYRIILLGDSFTFGWGVQESDNFKSVLERILNQRSPTEIINFGIGNYNTEQEVNLFLEKGLKYHPDKVVVFFFINDAEPMQQPSGLAFLYHSQLVTYVWSKIHALMSDYGDQIHNYKGYYADLYRADSPGWSRAQQAFLRLRDVCREHGIELQVVLIPELHQLQNYPFADQHQQVVNFLTANGIPALDLAPLFKDQHEPTTLWVSPDDAHANARGHELIATYAADFIAGKQDGGGNRAANAAGSPPTNAQP